MFHQDNPKSQKRPIPEPIQLPAEKRIHKDVSKSQEQFSPEPIKLPAEALSVEEEVIKLVQQMKLFIDYIQLT